jgi:ATP-dependent Lhr-like helicase
VTEFGRLHPSLQYHVVNTLGWGSLRPTQLAAIAPIHAGSHCLLLAPTAGGKTEAAAIPILSRMLYEGWQGTSVLYVCPIKALLNNLEPRLSHYAGLVGRRVEVWHGDISQSRKRRALAEAPDILLTTPESIEGMLISARIDRESWFGNLRAVIVDELHAFASDDRGWHLRSVLGRLDRYLATPLQRIGLSATVSNPEELLSWLAPRGKKSVVGSAAVSTDADVTIDYVGSLENAATVIARLHRGEKRLVFCDSRASAEQLGAMIRAHGVRTFISHASLSLSERKQAEEAFSQERECAIVATSTLELGIDVGDLDRVIQIDAPSTVSSFLQRMGRTGRRAGGRRNCLFLATDGGAFLQALGVTQKWAEGWVEAARPPTEPWNIVAQQALAHVLEEGSIPEADLSSRLAECFPELAPADIRSLVSHLVDRGYLCHDGQLLQIGPETERHYARSQYRELLASFSGSPLLTGRYGSADIGYIDPSVVVGSKEDRLLLLSGRSWRVLDVDWKKRIAWLEPASAGGVARWVGGSQSIGPEISQAVRTVLANGASTMVCLSRRAQEEVIRRSEVLPVTDGTSFVMIRSPGVPDRTWTFAGTRANRTLARHASRGLHAIRFDALSVQAPAGDLEVVSKEFEPLSSEELVRYGESIKFSPCVPRDLLSRMVIARNFEHGKQPAERRGI